MKHLLTGLIVLALVAAGSSAQTTQTSPATAPALAAGQGEAIGIGPEGTRQILAATGLKPEDVLRDPRACRGVQGLDAVLVGTVTSFPR